MPFIGYWSERGFDEPALRNALEHQGLSLVVIHSPHELHHVILKENCIAVVLDFEIGNVLSIIELERKHTRAFWLIQSENLPSVEINLLLRNGVHAVVSRALPPVQLAIRLKLVYEQYKATYDNQKTNVVKTVPRKMSSGELWQYVEKNLEILNLNHPWNPNTWPIEFLPDGSLPKEIPREPLDFKTLESELKNFIERTAKTLGAYRISLLSVKNNDGKHAYNILSNDNNLHIHEKMILKFMPQIMYSVNHDEPVMLNTPLPLEIDNDERPLKWQVDEASEGASVIVPLKYGIKVFAVLLIQFKNAITLAQDSLVKEGVSFLALPRRDYSKIDFLGRIYRNLLEQV